MKSEEVKEKIPGLSFMVSKSELQRKVGKVYLLCHVEDEEMWERAISKLDGLRLFSDVDEEVMDALSEELDTASDKLVREKRITEVQRKMIEERDARIKELENTLAVIGQDLGLG